MIVLFGVASVVMMISIVACLMQFDHLVRYMHEHHQEEWNRSGAPTGFFWVPEGQSWWSAWFSGHRMRAKWFFCEPEWAKKDVVADRIWRRGRVWYIGVWASWALIVVIVLVSP